MSTIQQLTEVFNDNFVAYFRSHMAHINIVGRNFEADHALLGEIYEDLQDEIDHLGELLRSLDAFAPDNISEVVSGSSVMDLPITGSADSLLADVMSDLETLKGCNEELIAVADREGLLHIANYAQDRVLTIAKFLWKLKSTLS